MLRETGEMLTALAPMLSDGRIDDADRPHATVALREIADVMGRLVSLQQQIIAACEPKEAS